MRILALDQSLTSTGWAIWSTGWDVAQSGTWNLAESGKGRAGGFVALHRAVAALHAEEPIDLIAYECPLKLPHDTVQKMISLYGVAAHVESIAHAKKAECVWIAQQEWRTCFFNGMAVTGRENLKRAAVERCRQFGMDPLSDDEAEAIGILDCVMHLRKIVPPWRMDNPLIQPIGS